MANHKLLLLVYCHIVCTKKRALNLLCDWTKSEHGASLYQCLLVNLQTSIPHEVLALNLVACISFQCISLTVESNKAHSVQRISVTDLNGLLNKAQAIDFQPVSLRSILLSFLHAVKQTVEYQDYISLFQFLESVSDAANLPSVDTDHGMDDYWTQRLISPRVNYRNAVAQVWEDSGLISESASSISKPTEKQKFILNPSKGKKHSYLSQIFSYLWGRNSVYDTYI